MTYYDHTPFSGLQPTDSGRPDGRRVTARRTVTPECPRTVFVELPLRTRPSMPDKVCVGPYGPSGASRAMARYSASWRVALAAPMLASERYPEPSGLTEPLAHASARRTATTRPAQTIASPTRLSKHLGR